jgi:hypothetical protein
MTFVRALLSTLLILGASAGLGAQQPFQYLGPNECLNCHDHAAEKEWYEKKEIPEVQRIFPDKSANAGHINSLNQLETPKSDEFAKAIGLKDKYDLNGPCVTCHATVYRGDANAGVSCESCHGPGSGYLKPHQTKDSYDLSVAQYGMTRLIGNMQGWTQQCTNCHVMNDDRLIKAGHPPGDDFDLGKRFLPVSLHFKKKYSATDVAAIGKSELEGIIRRRRGLTAVAEAPPAAPATPPAPAMSAAAAGTAAAPEAPAVPAAAAPPVTAAPSTAGTPTPAPARPSAPRAAAARVSAGPPPGSPTSIEPPPPVEAPGAFVPPPAPAAAPPVAAPIAATPAASAGPPISWLIGGGVLIVALAGFFWWLGTKARK